MIDGLDWTISVLEKIDHTPYLKELCRQYSVYDLDDKFRVIRDPISDLIDKNYEAGYFLSKYPYVLSLYGLDDGQMDHLNVDELPYLATLACLTWHFRHDHFCEGSLISRSIANGTLLRLFRHLRELYRTHPSISTLEELHYTNCNTLPCQPGIYRVLVPEKVPVSFIESPVIRVQKVIPQCSWSKNTTCARTNPFYISARQTGAVACGSGCGSTSSTAGAPPPTTKAVAPSGRWKTFRFCYWSTKSAKIVSSGNTSCWPLLSEKTAFILWQIGGDRQNKVPQWRNLFLWQRKKQKNAPSIGQRIRM